MNQSIKFLLLLALSVLCAPIIGQAAPIIIPADGSKHQIMFTQADPEVTILSSANTNESSRVTFEVLSATELLVNATSKKVKKSEKLDVAGQNSSGWSNKAIEFFANEQAVSTFRIGGSNSSSTGESRDPRCICLTETEIAYYLGDPATIAVLTASGYSITREGLCSFYFNGAGIQDCSLLGGNSSQTTSSQAIGIEMRDTCDKKSKSITRFKIKPNISFQGTLVATVSFKSEPYEGMKVAAHKPTSDGMWSPEPIFLFQTLGQGSGYGKEFVRVSKWSKTGPTKILDLKDGISDVYYRNYILHRVRSGRALRLGGKAVVEIRSNSGLTYGYCMPMQKKRMNFGGY